MGLLDVLNGMRNGPRGGQGGTSFGGMSPITMAILALLAYKGIKHLGGAQAPRQAPQPSGDPARVPGSSAATSGGGLGDILGGLLGGGSAPGGRVAGASGGGGLNDLLRGGLAGGVLSGGLGSLLDQFQRSGQGDAADSWVSRGPNRDISEGDLAKSIGNDDIDALVRHTGMSRGELLAGLRRELPGAIDDFTPDGRVPTAQEIEERV